MSKYKPCPNCDGVHAAKVSFTWWGGVVGPSLLTHVKCQDCGTTYNGKTGASNTGGIIVYTVVTVAIVIALVVLLERM